MRGIRVWMLPGAVMFISWTAMTILIGRLWKGCTGKRKRISLTSFTSIQYHSLRMKLLKTAIKII